MPQANFRSDRTSEDLQSGAVSIRYEFSMLNEIAKIWPRIGEFPPLFQNMAIESFLVHFRNVRDFLFSANPLNDDVVASDFNSKAWSIDSSGWTETVPHERDRINKQLSHVSYLRGYYDKQWPIPAMAGALARKFTEFLKILPKDKQDLLQGGGGP